MIRTHLTSSFEAPLATRAVVAISAAIIAGSISSPRPGPEECVGMVLATLTSDRKRNLGS